jgi:ABC-type branched-subunit amino acid transport system ATPase component
MDVVFQLADRVTVAVTAARSPEEVRRGPAVRQAYLGHDN